MRSNTVRSSPAWLAVAFVCRKLDKNSLKRTRCRPRERSLKKWWAASYVSSSSNRAVGSIPGRQKEATVLSSKALMNWSRDMVSVSRPPTILEKTFFASRVMSSVPSSVAPAGIFCKLCRTSVLLRSSLVGTRATPLSAFTTTFTAVGGRAASTWECKDCWDCVASMSGAVPLPPWTTAVTTPPVFPRGSGPAIAVTGTGGAPGGTDGEPGLGDIVLGDESSVFGEPSAAEDASSDESEDSF
mmetsp:Transcript_82086/g.171830  ORF Transcript_82086/g.171830 Transcript_82086/m.171830 type:complete len:242 (-) Transcript_82086:329-1054(-)